MNLVGKFEFNNVPMYLYLKDLKDSESFMLLSKYHREDRFGVSLGNSPQYPVISNTNGLKNIKCEDYAIEIVVRRKKTGVVQKYGDEEILETVLDAIAFARSYRFPTETVTIKENEVHDGVEHYIYGAADQKVQYNIETLNGLTSYLYVKTNAVKIELSRANFAIRMAGIKLREVKQQQKKRILTASLKTIDYETLAQVLDMNWYRDKDGLKKDYRSVKSNQEFEIEVFGKFAEHIKKCQKANIKADISADTETTGLNVYNLSDDNEDKDHCVAIPICWEIGKSFVIFTDMLHFANADNNYVISRLAELFERFEGERTIEYYYQEKDGKIEKRELVFKRSDINLIGHNAGFDGRVFYSCGKKFWFDQDTLQMAFDINPQSVRGNKKLKVLTRYFFGAETPELEDILGKGNEDKYRYLVDEIVAKIYGCADADFTLAVFYELRKLMTDKMFYWYQKQDIPIINILYMSEYYGMQTISEKIIELAEETKQNIEILKNMMYSYVGVYLQFQNDVNMVNAKNEAGLYATEEDYRKDLNSITLDSNAVYKFEFKPAQLKHIIYDVMKYPVYGFTDGKDGFEKKPKLDKYVIKKLLRQKLSEGDVPPRKLQHDILVFGADADKYRQLRSSGKKNDSKKADSMVLISANEFNSLKYPLALILQKYADMNKEYTSYYKPMEEQNLEGKIFKGYNLARIETRRISNPGQTMKGKLKALIRSYSDEHYILDFDMSQIEYRLMLSLSGFTSGIQKMNDPESDYHTETASMIEGIPPHNVTPKQRKNAKSTSFGVPYGLGDGSMCENMFGDKTKEHMIATRLTLAKWKKVNAPIINLLEKARLDALTEWKISDDLRNFMDMWKKDKNKNYVLDDEGNRIPVPISKVENLLGFYRVFSLEGIDLSKEGMQRRAEGNYTAEESSIRRKAGNYPIQSAAAEIFRIILIRFYEACIRYGIADKVVWHMLIHDELLCSVKKDVHPFLLYKIVKEACMITMKGHTKYFVGINVGNTWAEAKADEREAPIHFVNRIIKRYDAGEFKDGHFDNPWEFIKPYREQYIEDRIFEVVTDIQPEFPRKPLDICSLLEKFSNYTVRAYVKDYPVNGEVMLTKDKGDPDSVAKYDNAEWIKKLESWAIARFGESSVEFIGLDGKKYLVAKCSNKVVDDGEEEFVDFDNLFDDEFNNNADDDSYWSFDEGSAEELYFCESADESAPSFEEDDFEFDLSNVAAHDVNEITIVKQKYKNLKVLNNQIVIQSANAVSMKAIQGFLKDSVVNIGIRVVFKYPGVFQRWEKIRENFDLELLDKAVGLLNSDFSGVECIGGCVFAKVNTLRHKNKLEDSLKVFPGNDYRLYFVLKNGEIIPSVQFSNAVSIRKLRNIVKSWR